MKSARDNKIVFPRIRGLPSLRNRLFKSSYPELWGKIYSAPFYRRIQPENEPDHPRGPYIRSNDKDTVLTERLFRTLADSRTSCVVHGSYVAFSACPSLQRGQNCAAA